MMNIISFEELDSTNKYAKQNIDILADKTVVSTDIQTSGYGRFDRAWVDLGAENVYMTFVLKPSESILPVYSNLTQYLSLILCRQLEEMGLDPKIKWPNDILLSGKKVCGILAEAVVRGSTLRGIVLGVGINLNASADALNKIDRPATSLNLELNKSINKQEFIQKLVEGFFVDYEEFLKRGFSFIKEGYEAHSILKRGKGTREKGNEVIKVSVFKDLKIGVFEGFDDDGTLLLLNLDGSIEKINMGELV